MKNITIVTAFFDIGRGELSQLHLRRNNDEYFDYFKFWARIENALIVYTQPCYAKKIREIRKKYGLESKTTVIEIEDIFSIEENLYNKMKSVEGLKDFKAFRYYDDSLSNLAAYDYVMLMKYWCMKNAVELSLTTEMIAWLDFGFNHGGKCFSSSSEFAFEWKYDFSNKIHLFALQDPRHIMSALSLQLQFDTIMGPILVCPDYLCNRLWEMVRNAMNALIMIDCIDDDQQLLLMAYKFNPELFEIHLNTWFKPLKDFGGGVLSLNEDFQKKADNNKNKLSKIRLLLNQNLFIFYGKKYTSQEVNFLCRISNIVSRFY